MSLIGRTAEIQELLDISIVHSTLVTTYGLKYNEYSGDFTQVVTLDDLFRFKH